MTQKFLWISICLLFLACANKDGSLTDPTKDGFTLRFKLTSVKDSMPLDSLAISITLGDTGKPISFTVNLKTGVSTAQVLALEGQDYSLTFQLFSAGYAIGHGESKGVINRDLSVELVPIWDEDNLVKAKKVLGLGILLPPTLAQQFNLVVAGKPFDLALDSLKGTTYRWFVEIGDSILVSGESERALITLPDSLSGKTVLIKVMAVAGTKIKEERIWSIKVLASLPKDRLAWAQVRNDTTAISGTRLAYHYDAHGALSVLETYDSLKPSPTTKPVGIESLSYDDKGNRIQAKAYQPDGGVQDSIFNYNSNGNLILLQVTGSTSQIRDSLFYDKNNVLSQTKRYVSDSLQEIVTFTWSGQSTRIDSVFTPGTKGLELSRLIQNTFQNANLIERRVWVNKNVLTPYKKETLTYNGLGLRATYLVFTEGVKSELDESTIYTYDTSGKLTKLMAKDEVSGDLLFAVEYQYESSAPAPKLTALIRKVNAAASPLGDIAFAHEGWRLGHEKN